MSTNAAADALSTAVVNHTTGSDAQAPSAPAASVAQAERDHLQQLFKQAPGFVCVLRGPTHVFEIANDAYYQLIGHRDVVGHDLAQVLPEVVDQGFLAKLDHVFLTGEPYIGRAVPIQLQRQENGPLSQRYIDIIYQPIREEQGELTGIFVQGHDVTEAHELAQEVSYQAAHDPLTGLLNRREFAKRVQQLLTESPSATETPHCLLYLDLDQFKIVNDRSGHHAGDALLKQVATLLQRQVRPVDLLARLGGDEFAIVLTQCATQDGLGRAEQLRREIDNIVFVWEGRRYSISISIGLAPLESVEQGSPQSYTQALSRADAACFLAKEKGRNRTQVHHESDAALTRQRRDMDWASRLREAMRDDRIVLFSQRIHAVQAHNKSARRKQELLARLLDTDGVLVPPSVFIPAAERYGLMPQLDRHIVHKAMKTLAGLPAHERANARYFINLSGATLNEDTLPSFIENTLAAFPELKAEQFCFEITETAAVSDLNCSRLAMQRLIAKGFSFALDDFGSGMSSFTYLRELPVQYVKIDGAFVTAIVDDPVSAVMVESVARVAKTMGIKTIAEFVESAPILQRLIALDIDFAQGYGLCVPVPLPT